MLEVNASTDRNVQVIEDTVTSFLARPIRKANSNKKARESAGSAMAVD